MLHVLRFVFNPAREKEGGNWLDQLLLSLGHKAQKVCLLWSLLHSWNFPWWKFKRKITLFLLLLQSVLISLDARPVAQSCPTLCDLMDCSPPGSSVHGISQARILEWVAISFSRGSSQPRDQTQVYLIAGRFFTIWATLPNLPSYQEESRVPRGVLEWQLQPVGIQYHCFLFFDFPIYSSDSFLSK